MWAVLTRFSYPGEGNIQIITGLSQRIPLMDKVQCHEFLEDHLMTTLIRCPKDTVVKSVTM